MRPEPPRLGLVVQGKMEGYVLLAQIQVMVGGRRIQTPWQDCLYGHVMAGAGLVTGDVVAVKSLRREEVDKKRTGSDLPETPLAEVFFAPLLHGCQNIAVVREVIGSDEFHFIVSDFANGEDLLELLKLYPYGLPEEVTALAMRAAAEGLAACHRRGVALQDFSLENCLLSYDVEGRCQIALCDPGQAVIFERDHHGVESPVENRGCIGKKFRPPEIFTLEPYLASKVDSWCLGWSTWYFLFATEIFESAHPADTDQQWIYLLHGRYSDIFTSCGINESSVSEDSRDFIFRLLDPDPVRRMSVLEALEHPFLEKVKHKRLNRRDIPISNVEEDEQKKSIYRMALQTLFLTPDNDKPALLRAFSHQMPILRQALQPEIDKPIAEVKSRARTIRRLLSEAGPSVPRCYFTHYASMFCLPSKPSHSLVVCLEKMAANGYVTARPGSPSVAFGASFRRGVDNASSKLSRPSPRGLCAPPLTRRSFSRAEVKMRPIFFFELSSLQEKSGTSSNSIEGEVPVEVKRKETRTPSTSCGDVPAVSRTPNKSRAESLCRSAPKSSASLERPAVASTPRAALSQRGNRQEEAPLAAPQVHTVTHLPLMHSGFGMLFNHTAPLADTRLSRESRCSVSNSLTQDTLTRKGSELPTNVHHRKHARESSRRKPAEPFHSADSQEESTEDVQSRTPSTRIRKPIRIVAVDNRPQRAPIPRPTPLQKKIRPSSTTVDHSPPLPKPTTHHHQYAPHTKPEPRQFSTAVTTTCGMSPLTHRPRKVVTAAAPPPRQQAYTADSVRVSMNPPVHSTTVLFLKSLDHSTKAAPSLRSYAPPVLPRRCPSEVPTSQNIFPSTNFKKGELRDGVPATFTTQYYQPSGFSCPMMYPMSDEVRMQNSRMSTAHSGHSTERVAVIGSRASWADSRRIPMQPSKRFSEISVKGRHDWQWEYKTTKA